MEAHLRSVSALLRHTQVCKFGTDPFPRIPSKWRRANSLHSRDASRLRLLDGKSFRRKLTGLQREHKELTLCQLIETGAASKRDFESESSGTDERILFGNFSRGQPLPFGATATSNGVNFSIHSSGATSVSICLFTQSDLQQGHVTAEIPLDPILNRTGDVWHIFISEVVDGLLYGYRVNGPFSPNHGHRYNSGCILIDPYAKAVVSREVYGVPGPDGNCWPQMGGMVPVETEPFDWEGDVRPRLQQKDLIIYEMHVRGFTRHKSSKVNHPGTFLGLIEKLGHLKELGINAIELMPCHEFNELEYYLYNSVMGDYKMNFWGYSTVNFFSPMIRYTAAGNSGCGLDAINEFKTLVREAHKLGMEVFMDVVFNHTAEGNERGPTFSFRGLDNSVFYMLAPKGEFYNYSGCGNTFNCNHPIVRRFIVDCLRYWVTEMHVDGFRFDLASILTRASSLWDKANVFGSLEGSKRDFLTTGTPLGEPPLIDMISNDPVLRDVKLIAEPWDCGGLYQVGSFPHWGLWSEWNGKFRDTVRKFIKGTDGVAGPFADCLCGSPRLFQDGGRQPWHSVNFVTAHDGFSLADLVSYNEKHNFANGESNNDGETHNNSWNCGEEGELVRHSVQCLRQRQLRNFIVALSVSQVLFVPRIRSGTQEHTTIRHAGEHDHDQGVPMMTMGDEYAHTKGGNNNTYCHDNYINYFRWDKTAADPDGFYRFTRLMLNFRRKSEAFGLADIPHAERLQWHGTSPDMPDWSEKSRFVAFTIVDDVNKELYIAFNGNHRAVMVTLPERQGFKWQPLVDTSKVSPYDFLSEDLPYRAIAITQYIHFLNSNIYPMSSYSSILLNLVPEEQ